jgi:hypothetical protein
LAGESAGEDVDGLEVGTGQLADVAVAGDVRPVSREDPSAIGVGLALPEDAEAGALEAEVEPADPGEQRPDGERVIGHRGARAAP